MYNVTMMRVLVTIVVVENQCVTYYEFAFVTLGIQRANVHARYWHLCPARLCNIFPHYLIRGTFFMEKSLNMKCVF